MSDPIFVYRIIQPDIEILMTIAEHLEKGMLNRDAEFRAAQALRLLIGRARVNPYEDTGDIIIKP